MKKLLTSVAMVLLLVGCAKEYDDSGIKTRLSAIETKLIELESNIQSLQSAVGDGVFVAKVQEYADPETGKTVGVTITYTNGDVKYFEISPKEDYEGPVLGVIQSGSGQLVWAIDGIAIQIDGKEVPVYQTPVFTIDDDGNLWVEVDGEKVNLGPVQNEGATLVDGIFTDIKVEQDKVVLTLSDNTVVNIPFAEAFKLNIEKAEYTYSDALKPIDIAYTVSAKTENTVVGVTGYNPKEFDVVVEAEKIVVTPLKYSVGAAMMVYADSKIGLTSIVNVIVEQEGVEIVDLPVEIGDEEYDYIAPGDGGTIEARVVSNVDFTVESKNDWIHVVETKGTLHTIVLSLDENPKEEAREGMVALYKSGVDHAVGLVQIITIWQDKGQVETGAANLSKKESANSYLIYAPGEYKFKAVKGNSEESVGAVAKAEILWETDNTTTAPAANAIIASVKVDGESIVFSTPEILVPGNALIAAKDEAGTILWSWHIWIPETEIVNSTYGDIVNVPMMDRDLGALVAPNGSETPNGRTIGFLYQWGRKDPFPAIADISSSTPFATNGTISLASEKQNFTVAETIQNPTVYVVTGGDSNKTWMTAEEMGSEYWAAEKALYDPCPPGYIVPSKASGSLWESAAACTVDETNKWVKAGSSEIALFPVGGYLDQGSITKVGERSYHWTTEQSADKNIAYMLYANGSSVTVEVQRMSRGGNVRCVVANEGAIVPPTPNPGEGGGEPGGIPDLSKEGSANCYIIPATTDAGAQYKFKAVKGNSEESVGAVASAEVFWETWNTADEPTVGSVVAAAEYADGYVTITMPAETIHAGNAVVAVKDADGNILWSWHIWVPATEVAADPAGAAMLGGTILDRNLGALIAPVAGEEALTVEALGLYYQWGRKDPFPGPRDFTDYPSKAMLAGAQFTKDANQRTVEYGIAHPNEYSYGAGSCDWLAEPIADLWDKEGNKTIYDPCPVGYKVPAYDAELPMWKMTNDNWTFSDYFWMTNSASTSVFPLAGYIDDGNGSFVMKKRAFYWSSKEYTDHIRACGADVRAPSYNSEKTYKARAASVRCVAE